MSARERYIYALNVRALTPLYDAVLPWLMREAHFKRRLIAQAHIGPRMRVLDLGCGTGTLAIMLKQVHPDAAITGLDGDPQMLARARAKADAACVHIAFDEGLAGSLPYPDSAFDRVLSSLMLHHLGSDGKLLALHEAYRVLAAGGELHVADLGRPHNAAARIISLVMRRLEHASDNIDGRLPAYMPRTGFADVSEPNRYMTLTGTLSLYRARKPASAQPDDLHNIPLDTQPEGL